jgi:hypothetical protein
VVRTAAWRPDAAHGKKPAKKGGHLAAATQKNPQIHFAGTHAAGAAI